MTIDTAERLGIISNRINSGQDSYAGRLSAWHLLGNVVGEFTDYQTIERASKCDYDVFKSQLRDGLGRPVEAWGTFRWSREAKAMGDKTAATFLAPVGKAYHVIHHNRFEMLANAMVDQVDGAFCETMGFLDHGAKVWLQVDPNISMRVGDDVSKTLLTFMTGHDGETKFIIFVNGERVVCRNTWRIAKANRLGARLEVRHTKGADQRISDLAADMQEIRDQAKTMEEKLQFLATRKVTKESLGTIMNRLFPPPENEESSTKRRENVLGDVLALYEQNDGDQFPEQRGTMYNLWNAITEYTDHYRPAKGASGKAAQSRAISSQFGSGAKLKSVALETILEAANEAPSMVRESGQDHELVKELLLR